MTKHSANNHDINANKKLDKSVTGNAEKIDQHRPLALTSPKQRQGSHFERRACEFLQAQGLVLIAQNWQQPKVGELDLIMLEVGQAWSTLVFIEVRQRKSSDFGGAALSVTASKQRKIIKTAKYFLQQHPKYADYDCRFDVIAYDVSGFNTAMNGAINSTKEKNKVLHNSDIANQENTLINQPTANPPEWLMGAFIAKAW